MGGGKGNSGKKPEPVKKDVPKGFKFLLLGSGESGKSTFHKQAKILFENADFKDELSQFTNVVYANLVVTVQALCTSLEKRQANFEDPENEKIHKALSALNNDPTNFLIKAKEKYSQEVHSSVKKIWADKSIQKAFQESRYEYHVFDGALHFFKDLDRLSPPKYEPSIDDILMCRRKTTGLVSCEFVHKINGQDTKLTIVDVGGQRNERKKWQNQYEGVNAVMFVSSLSEYDQKCYEDDVTNRMVESIDLFDETINGPSLKDLPILLFFNKNDLFKQKLQTSDLSKTFADYKDGSDPDKAFDYIKQRYLKTNRYDPNRIHCFQTTATDRQAVRDTFESLFKLLEKGVLDKKF